MNPEQGWEAGSVRSIAVLRPNALGDFIFCLPALHALRQRYPAARLSYIGQAWHADFLRGRPGPIDEVLVMPPYPGVGAPATEGGSTRRSAPEGGAAAPGAAGLGVPEHVAPGSRRQANAGAAGAAAGATSIEASSANALQGSIPAGGIGDPGPIDDFIARIRARRFDLALQLYGGGRHANPLLRRFGARHCVGMQASDAEPLDRNLHFADAVNKRLQLLEVAALAGAAAWPMHAPLQVTAQDRQQAARCVAPAAGDKLVLLQPGSRDPRRCWPARDFARLGDALSGRGMQILINGSQQEGPLVQSVIAAMRHPACDLSGKTSLHALCGLLERCALVVSNDTGPLHLALEIGVPAVGVYWFTNLIESAPLRQAGHRAAVSLQIHCPVCGAENIMQRCPHDASFVAGVSLDEVLAHALALLGDQHPRSEARA